jgi:NTP pyrophosphatase (non-canonical NTP hydrolase)
MQTYGLIYSDCDSDVAEAETLDELISEIRQRIGPDDDFSVLVFEDEMMDGTGNYTMQSDGTLRVIDAYGGAIGLCDQLNALLVGKVDLREYQAGVKRTCATTDVQETLKMALIGLTGEIGEMADPVKKHLWHGHDLDMDNLRKEVGDVMWYLATLCNALDISLEQAVAGNIEKLQKRYPDGFSSVRSLQRVD